MVSDAFGRTYNSEDVNGTNDLLYPGLKPPDDWTLFEIAGLTAKDIMLWHVAELPLESIPVQKVQFGLDEVSNVLWAVERTIDGRDVDLVKVDDPDPSSKKFNSGVPTGNSLPVRPIEYAY